MCERAYRGGTFPSVSAAGGPSMNGTGAGRRTARGTGSCGPSRPTPTSRAGSTGAWSASIRHPAVPISTRPGPARGSRASRKRTMPRHQDPPRRRRRLSPAGVPGHAGTGGRRTADDRGPGADPGPPPAGRTAENTVRPPRRRQGIQLTPQPPLPAKTPDQAHDPRTEGPAGQPQTPRQQGRPAHRLRQRDLQTPQRSRTGNQPAEERVGPSPPATTSGPVSSTAPSPPQPSGCGSGAEATCCLSPRETTSTGVVRRERCGTGR